MKRHTQTLTKIAAVSMVAGGMALSAQVWADEPQQLIYQNTITPMFTVQPECGMSVKKGTEVLSGDNTSAGYETTVTPGTTSEVIGGTKLIVSCNTATSSKNWQITAKGAGTTNNGAAVNQLTANNGAIKVNTGAMTMSGSVWGMQVTGTGAEATYSSASYAAVPGASGAIVAKGGTPVIGNEITTTYKVKLATDQAQGTYTGVVVYTFVAPN